jgi:hypothetical protein
MVVAEHEHVRDEAEALRLRRQEPEASRADRSSACRASPLRTVGTTTCSLHVTWWKPEPVRRARDRGDLGRPRLLGPRRIVLGMARENRRDEPEAHAFG